jgi:hypothetical protein
VNAAADLLVWYEEIGYGYFPVHAGNPYDGGYFRKYQGYEETPMGKALTRARIDLVRRHAGSEVVVDIGIGSGQFVRERGLSNTRGYDVNPHAVRWLLERDVWFDPYFQDPPNASCFDSLEHMKKPDHFIERIQRFLFVSIPIFENREHAAASKHFRPDEHYWYFTRNGLVLWMKRQGFGLLEENHMEVELGREGIGTFVFRRS